MRFLTFLICCTALAQVSAERLRDANKEPGNWMSYSRDWTGQRYSPLTEVNSNNAGNLKVKWAFQMPDPGNQVSPIVMDGVMYLTGPNSATALDAATGRKIWQWKRPLPADYRAVGFGHTNRGPAVLGDAIYVTTLDCYLVALDLKTGSERWATKVADYKLGYSLTVAPLAIPGKILLGTSGGEAGIRGFVDAYDAKTGKQAWRFHTVPGPGEKGNETWQGDSWKTGGGSTWVTGAYDPALNLVYWGVGNPGPLFNGDSREGDNLYTCSMVALDGNTGKLRWHFQFTPHDTHDWDAAHVPVLLDAQVNGRLRKVVVNANRNGFYYVLDRTTGEFLAGRPYVKQTWAKGLDDQGRPAKIPNMDPTEKGVVVWPNLNGATVWFSPSFSSKTGLFYVAAREIGAEYFKLKAEYKPGMLLAGGGEHALPPDDTWGAIRALKVATGELQWEFKLHSPAWAGVMSTAGNLVFSGSDEGNFYALDATSGGLLWDFQTGGGISSNPISFGLEGKQYIAISADRVLYVFGL